MKAVRFSVARIDEASPVGFTGGWAVVRHEAGEPSRFVSRIFLKEQDALEHAHRLTMQQTMRKRDDASSG